MASFRRVINNASVPATGNPYSQAVASNGFVFVSGQVAWDPATERAVEGGFDVQAHRVFENLKAVLEASGSSLEQVLKTTCFLTDLKDAPAFNSIYRGYFKVDLPARSTIQVGGLASGFLVEVEAVAVTGD